MLRNGATLVSSMLALQDLSGLGRLKGWPGETKRLTETQYATHVHEGCFLRGW